MSDLGFRGALAASLARVSTKVRVHWCVAKGKAWEAKGVLYMYTLPGTNEIVYIGKAFDQTVQERWDDHQQDGIWRRVWAKHSNRDRVVNVAVGVISTEASKSDALVSRVEGLLINRVKPVGNQMNVDSRDRIVPRVEVTCSGAWPSRQTLFVDLPVSPPVSFAPPRVVTPPQSPKRSALANILVQQALDRKRVRPITLIDLIDPLRRLDR